MISDFHQLSERISQLAELTQALRRENAELRNAITGLNTEKADLLARMDEAHRRLAGLLDKLPADAAGQEAA